MSVQTIVGGIIGAVAGFVVGGPMGAVVGAGLGAGLGAMATPIKVQGAKVGEEELASVASGTPIGIILGEGGIKGDLLWQGPRVVVKVKEEQEGKGGGTTVENEEVQRDYAIHFCESNARRGTKIRSVKIIRRNKIIVYDTRPESKLTGADNAKFMANVTFYFGDADQGVDPTYEAHFGHLGAPAYRNQFTMVVRQHLLGKFGNAIPTYEVVTCGGPLEDVEEPPEAWRWLGTGQTIAGTRASIRPMNSAMDWIGDEDIESCETNSTAMRSILRYGNNMLAIINNGEIRVAPISAINDWSPGPTGIVSCDHSVAFGGYAYFALGGNGVGYLTSTADTVITTNSSMLSLVAPFERQVTGIGGHDNFVMGVNGYGAFFVSSDRGASWSLGAQVFGTERFYTSYGALGSNYSGRSVIAGRDDLIGLRMKFTDDGGHTFTNCSQPVFGGLEPNQTKYCGDDRWLVACRNGGTTPGEPSLFKSLDDGVTWTAVTLPVDMHFGIQFDQNIATDSNTGRVVIAGAIPGFENKFYYSDDLITWTEIDMTGTLVSGVTDVYPPGYSYDGDVILPNLTDDDEEFPDAEGHYVDKYHGTYSGRDTPYVVPQEHDCSMSLASMIQVLSKRTPVPPAILDTSRVEDIMVRGVSFRATGPVRNAIDTLAELYQFDVVDSGGGITIVPRGGPIDVVVEDGDILLSSKDVTKKKRGQQSEFPKIATLRYVDPTQGFEESSQRSVIKSKDFRATGEKTFTVSVTMMPDEAATQIARIHAEMQDQLEGGIQFDLPLKYLAVIPSCVISYLGKRYRVTKRRVEPWKIIVDSAVYDRASTYTLTAQGTVTGHTPTPQSGLVGPTMFAPMNMPVAIDAYDKPCLHAVVQGVSPGWRGADIYIKRGAGPYELTVSNMSPGVMGELTDSIEALSARGIDKSQTLKFKLYANGEAESITFDQLLEEKNPFALVKPDYTTSIGQFMDVTEVDPQIYEATGLSWGGLDTSAGSFTAGTKIALLSKVQMIPLRASDLGQTIKVKAVSRGSAVEAAPEHTITLTTMESLREWQPYFVKEVWSETGVCLAWIGRGRLGTSRAPLHSQYFEGYTVRLVLGAVSFEIDTTNQELCISAATLASKFGPTYGHPTITVRAKSRMPTDEGNHDSPPAPGPTTPPSVGASGGPASTNTGPNNGFPDNAPPLYPLPTVFDVPTMPDPGFDNPNTILRWRKQDGSPLGPEWSMVDGKLKFQGSRGIHRAYDYGTRFGMAAQPFPRLSIQTDADVQNSVGTLSRIGVAWGAWTVGYAPSYLEASGTIDGEGLSYLDETSVSHTWLHEIMRTGGGVNLPGQYLHLNFMPVVEHVVGFGFDSGSATVDNFDMQVSLIDPPVTAETPYNLDLANGMDGISLYPDPDDTNEFVPDISVAGGVMTATFHSIYGNFRWAWWEEPFENADAVDKFCKLNWEGWSNDTTVRTNNTGKFYPVGGVCAGLAFRSADGVQLTFSLAGLVERGDFTPREGYHHVPIDPSTGYTVHAAMLFVGNPGFQAKMRNYTAASTNDPYPETP